MIGVRPFVIRSVLIQSAYDSWGLLWHSVIILPTTRVAPYSIEQVRWTKEHVLLFIEKCWRLSNMARGAPKAFWHLQNIMITLSCGVATAAPVVSPPMCECRNYTLCRVLTRPCQCCTHVYMLHGDSFPKMGDFPQTCPHHVNWPPTFSKATLPQAKKRTLGAHTRTHAHTYESISTLTLTLVLTTA